MVRSFGLKEAKKGSAAIFSLQGKMFLKHYAGCSDKKLIEGRNGNLDWQFFCGICLGTDHMNNHKMVGYVCCELADKLDIGTVQKAVNGHWSPHIGERLATVMDASCY